MSNTYTVIHLQLVFAVKYREALILPEWENRLYRYVSGVVRKLGHKLLIINGMPDHVHLLVGLKPNQSLSDLMRIVKGESSEWINKMRLTRGVFRWQEGYGAFSYHKDVLPAVCSYIENQKQHHKKVRFLDEYEAMLKEFRINYQPGFLFKEPA
jgi:REP element-mobilizing transposase RayT